MFKCGVPGCPGDPEMKKIWDKSAGPVSGLRYIWKSLHSLALEGADKIMLLNTVDTEWVETNEHTTTNIVFKLLEVTGVPR